MPALNFQQQFAMAVQSGQKRQTIRAPRKDGKDPKAGQTLYLYVGMRTKGCEKLREAKAKSVQKIHISDYGVAVDGDILSWEGEKVIAEADGFAGPKTMRDWFRRQHGLPFEGYLICW